MKLTEQQRAERALMSEGRAPGLLQSFPIDVQAKLAALCSETGEMQPGTREVLDEYWDAQKAVVDPPAKVEVKGENLESTMTVGTEDGTLVKDCKPEDEVKHGES